MTKTGSPCEIALFGHSGSHAPQLMQSLVIIVAMTAILLVPRVRSDSKKQFILDDNFQCCKSPCVVDSATMSGEIRRKTRVRALRKAAMPATRTALGYSVKLARWRMR